MQCYSLVGTLSSFMIRVLCLFSVAALGATLTLALSASAPVGAKPNQAMEGAELFATRGCTHCHGAEGKGTDQGPSLRELRKHRRPAEIERQIVYGGGAMPAFGDTLDHAQVESLVSFLRAKTWIQAPVHPDNVP